MSLKTIAGLDTSIRHKTAGKNHKFRAFSSFAGWCGGEILLPPSQPNFELITQSLLLLFSRSTEAVYPSGMAPVSWCFNVL